MFSTNLQARDLDFCNREAQNLATWPVQPVTL